MAFYILWTLYIEVLYSCLTIPEKVCREGEKLYLPSAKQYWVNTVHPSDWQVIQVYTLLAMGAAYTFGVPFFDV